MGSGICLFAHHTRHNDRDGLQLDMFAEEALRHLQEGRYTKL